MYSKNTPTLWRWDGKLKTDGVALSPILTNLTRPVKIIRLEVLTAELWWLRRIRQLQLTVSYSYDGKACSRWEIPTLWRCFFMSVQSHLFRENPFVLFLFWWITRLVGIFLATVQHTSNHKLDFHNVPSKKWYRPWYWTVLTFSEVIHFVLSVAMAADSSDANYFYDTVGAWITVDAPFIMFDSTVASRGCLPTGCHRHISVVSHVCVLYL